MVTLTGGTGCNASLGPNAQRRASFDQPLAQAANLFVLVFYDLGLARQFALQSIQLTNLLLERSNVTILLRSNFLLLRQVCLEISEFGEPFLIASTFLRMAFGSCRIALPPFVHFIDLCLPLSLQ